MERLCVMIYETDARARNLLHDVLVAYAVRQDVEVIIHWLKEPVQPDSVREAGLEANLAFLCADDAERARQIGALLYQANPACALLYYGSIVPQVFEETVRYFTALFPPRPIRYLHRPTRQDFADALMALSAAISAQKHFFWETKSMKYRLPYGSIRYFRSDRNYVYVQLQSGAEYAFLGKLSAIEPQLPKSLFVRVHQSYLVNRTEIIAVDKQKKAILLRGGEELFISKARYPETLAACGAEEAAD